MTSMTMVMTTPRRMSLTPFLASEEGQRIAVPEGGELVCYRNTDDRLVLKVEYSRELMVKLSGSIFCHQRPSGLAAIADEMPELLGIPRPIPTTGDLPPPPPNLAQHLLGSPVAFGSRLFSPLRGPVTEADKSVLRHRRDSVLDKRMLDLSMSELEGAEEEFKTPAKSEGRDPLPNPSFT